MPRFTVTFGWGRINEKIHLGAIWLVARTWYAAAYLADPATRGRGFLVAFLAFIALWLGALVGVLRALF